MAKSIRKKFIRSDAPPGQMRIQPRDVAILRDLASFRFLNTEQVLSLHPGGRRNILQRLSWLYHSGFVERPESQKHIDLPSGYLVYALGRKGAELAFAENRSVQTWSRLNAKISSPNLAHALMISQFRAVLTLALQKQGGSISRWFQGYDLKDELTIKRKSPAIVPDGFFTMKLGGKQWHFFLETDRSTMSHHRFLSKMRAYWTWFAEKTYNAHLKIENFRVLTVADTEGRTGNLRATTKSADARRSGSGLFLFACEKDYSLKNPATILSPIWLSAKDSDKHSFFE
ncbi:MAG: replication-relaxation family protein [bacterium]|nr:replication-relaxation family protein [bacterium]